MEIIGVGIDLVEITRVERMWRRWGERFLSRVFTEGERSYALRQVVPAERLAVRFAAKEAAFKALGRGFGGGLAWREVEVLNEPSGRPVLRLSGRAQELARRLAVEEAHLTLTHDSRYALAHVILMGGSPGPAEQGSDWVED